jgi:hypothetical protein
VYLPLETVFPNESASPGFLKLLLQQLDKSDVIVACSRLHLYISDSLLDHPGTWLERHNRKQLAAASSFFKVEELARIESFFQQHPGCSIFFGGQLLELIRWAALYCPDDGSSKADLATDRSKRNILARSLLTVSNLWATRVYRDQLASPGDGNLAARRIAFLPRARRSISETTKGPNLAHVFARGRTIIVDYLCRQYPDFPDRFRKRAGLTLDDYYACLLYIVLVSIGLWGNGDAPQMSALRTFETTSDNADLANAMRQIMELRSQSLSELTDALWKGKAEPTDSDFSTLEHKVFRDRPILRLDDRRGIIMVPMFLRDMALGPLFLSGDIDRSLTEFGTAFEEYCRDIFSGMYPESQGLASRLAPSTFGKTKSGSQVQLGDLLLDCLNKTVMIECKASLLREDSINSIEPSDYVELLRSKYGSGSNGNEGDELKGVAQLANVIVKVGSSEWVLVDTFFPIREHIVPVLLVHDSLLDAIPHPWFLAREFAALVEAANADLGAARMRVGCSLAANLILVTIDDLESLESSIQTFALCDLLQDYDVNCPDRMVNLHNYIVSVGKYRDSIVYNQRIGRIFSKALQDLGRQLEQLGQK